MAHEIPTAASLDFQDIPHDYVGPDDVSIKFPDDDKEQLLGSGRKVDSSAPVANQSIWSLEYYKVFFNVSTSDVLGRLRRSLTPPKSSFYKQDEVPDLYGPFWIATTLVVILAITGNFASYIEFLPTNTVFQWKYDFKKVTLAASVFYAMISIVPMVVHFSMRRIGLTGNSVWMTHVISLYGYSFFSYVPAAFICVPPIELLRWLVIAGCFSVSTYFVVRNIRGYFPNDQLDWDNKSKFQSSVLIAVIVLLHFVVALVTKLYFFHYNLD